MIYRETFLQIQLRPLQHLIRRNWVHGGQEYQNRFTHQWRRRMIIEPHFKIRDVSLDRQSKVLSFLSGRDSPKNYGADQQRLQISDLHFDKFPTQATIACWKIRFKTEVGTCSQFPTEAMHWVKEVETVDSVDDLMSSSSIKGILMPNLKYSIRGLLQYWTVSSIILKKKGQSGITKTQKQDRFLRGRQIAYLIHEYFRRELCRPVYFWSSKWRYSEIRF